MTNTVAHVRCSGLLLTRGLALPAAPAAAAAPLGSGALLSPTPAL